MSATFYINNATHFQFDKKILNTTPLPLQPRRSAMNIVFLYMIQYPAISLNISDVIGLEVRAIRLM